MAHEAEWSRGVKQRDWPCLDHADFVACEQHLLKEEFHTGKRKKKLSQLAVTLGIYYTVETNKGVLGHYPANNSILKKSIN